MRDVIFFDRDGTLGHFGSDSYGNKTGFFPNALQFLKQQVEKKRNSYITTIGNKEGWEEHITEVDHLLSGHFGNAEIDLQKIGSLYFTPGGNLRKVSDDYATKSTLTPEEKDEVKRKEKELRNKQDELYQQLMDPKLDDDKQKVNEIAAKIGSLDNQINKLTVKFTSCILVHKETGEPFDKSKEYKNPSEVTSKKDLYLARILVSPTDYANLRTVMIGDTHDASNRSDQETPIVVVSDQVREGNWGIVSIVLDQLFSDTRVKPFSIYNQLFVQGTNENISGYGISTRTVSLGGIDYVCERSDDRRDGKRRIIYCL
jgi:hypothetical protein